MSLPLEVRVAAIEEGLLDVQDTQARLTPLAPRNEGMEELQLKFRALEEHLEDELLKTGKALRKDFREELSHLRGRHQPIDHRAEDAARQILEEVQTMKTRLEELEKVVPDVKSLYSGLEVAVQRARDVKEVAPSVLAAVQDELRQTQAEVSKGNLPELNSKVESLCERLEVTSTVLRNDLGSRSSEMTGLREEVAQMHQRFDGELSALKLQLTQQLGQDVEVQISKVLEMQPQLVTELTERVNQLETVEKVEKVEKKTFEQLVKYVETSLLQLKDNFEEKMASQSSQVTQIESLAASAASAVEKRLRQRMDQLATSCQNSNAGLRELQWKVAKLAEKTATQHLADSAAQVAEFSALREELERTLEKTKDPQPVVHPQDLTEQFATHKELKELQEQMTLLWRQTGALVDEMQLLSPTVKQDLLRWKQGISAQVSEHEGRLKCLAETAGAAAVHRGDDGGTVTGRLVNLSDEVLLLRKELHSLRDATGPVDLEVRMEEVLKSAANSRQDIATLREELQTLVKQSELQQLQQAMTELVTKSETSTTEVQALHESMVALSEEMTSSRNARSKVQEEVAACMEEVSKSASSRQDITTLREELQTLAKQSQPHSQPLSEPVTKCQTSTSDSPQVASTSLEMQQMHEWLSKLEEEVAACMEEVSKSASSRQDIATLREELQTLAKQSQPHSQPLSEPVTKCQTSTSDSPQVASTSPEMQQMHEWLSKLEEDVKALTADPQHINELLKKNDDLTKQLTEIRATPELIEREVEQRFSHCDERLRTLQHFVSARLEAMNEACSASEKDVAKLREGLREEAERQAAKMGEKLEPQLEELTLRHLALGVLKMAQFLGVTTEDVCEKLGWKDAISDLVRMVEHAWLRGPYRLPEKASVLKLLRQKADLERVQGLQVQLEDVASFQGSWSAVSPTPPVPAESTSPALSETRQQLNDMTKVLHQLRRLQKVEEIERIPLGGSRMGVEDFRSQLDPPSMARLQKRPAYNGRSYSVSGVPGRS